MSRSSGAERNQASKSSNGCPYSDNVGVERHGQRHHRTFTQRCANDAPAIHQACALLIVEQPKAATLIIGSHRLFVVKTDAVVLDLGDKVLVTDTDPHPDVRRIRVLFHIVQRFFNDKPSHRLDVGVDLVLNIVDLERDGKLTRLLVFLDELPLLANGKVYRAALPAPEWSPDQSQNFIEPRTATERQLAGIWIEVLGIKRVGVHDDFFELCGHSLMAAQLVARVTESMQVGLPLRRLFDTPTIAGLAEHVETLQWALQGRATEHES